MKRMHIKFPDQYMARMFIDFYKRLIKRGYKLDKVVAISILCIGIVLTAVSIGLKFFHKKSNVQGWSLDLWQ